MAGWCHHDGAQHVAGAVAVDVATQRWKHLRRVDAH
jgi:hypothetical protein